MEQQSCRKVRFNHPDIDRQKLIQILAPSAAILRLYQRLHAQKILHNDPGIRHVLYAVPPRSAFDPDAYTKILGQLPWRLGVPNLRLIDFEAATVAGTREELEREMKAVTAHFGLELYASETRPMGKYSGTHGKATPTPDPASYAVNLGYCRVRRMPGPLSLDSSGFFPLCSGHYRT